MKKILFISDNLCSGGAQRQMVTVARLLKLAGHWVVVYCYDKDDFNAHRLQEAGIPIVWEIDTTNALRRIRNVRRFVRSGNFDTVISFLPTCNFLNDLSAIGGRKWKVITGERSSRESTFTSLRGKLFAWFQRYTDYIVCNSQNACGLWKHYRPDYSDKMRVIYNCVQLGPIHSDYVPKKEGKLHVVVAATYQYLKNPLGLANALSMMSKEQQNRLVVDWYGRAEVTRGNTQAYDETKRSIKEKGLENVFVLHSDTKDIADVMYQADAIMLLSQFEGLPNVICEGMALGKPIIMTRVSDYPFLVDESNGIICDADNPSSIKDAIITMSEKSITDLLKMGVESKTKAVRLFSAEQVTKQWKELL